MFFESAVCFSSFLLPIIGDIYTSGSSIDGVPSETITLQDLDLEHSEHLTVRFGIKTDAGNRGGPDLFGRNFGNYENDIILRLDLESSDI